jgi:hypothetical protein
MGGAAGLNPIHCHDGHRGTEDAENAHADNGMKADTLIFFFQRGLLVLPSSRRFAEGAWTGSVRI